MVLFLFVVMMLDINIAEIREGFVNYLPVGFLIGLVILLEMGMVVGPEFFGLENYSSPLRHTAGYSNTAELGSVLYTVYVSAGCDCCCNITHHASQARSKETEPGQAGSGQSV